MKKAQITGEVIRKIIIVVFIVVIVLYGLRGFGRIREKKEEVSAVMLNIDIKQTVEKNIEAGTTKREKVELPRTMDVCFVDLEKREQVINSYQITLFPRVKDALESGIKDNIFMLREGKIASSSYAHICLDEYPHFICTEYAKKPLTLMLEGRGKCTSVFFNMSIIVGDNEKNMENYPENPVFFIEYEKDGNWRDILRLVPVVMWNKDGTLEGYPYVAYFPAQHLPGERVLSELNERNGSNAVVFSNSEGEYTEEQITKLVFSDELYISYWSIDGNFKFQDVVLVDYDNKEAGLIAALYAAELNAPLIFVNAANIKDYEGWVKDKKIHIIDYLDDMQELNIANQKFSVTADYLKSQVISGRFSKLKSEIEIT
jgi:hypothetical protein